MTDTYIALLRKEADSDYGVEFPDLPGCVTAGTSLDDAAAMAREALDFHLEGLAAEGRPRPEPSALADILAKAESRGAVPVLVPAARPKGRATRVSVTIEEHLLAAIDAEAGPGGRSGFLAQAAQNALGLARTSENLAKTIHESVALQRAFAKALVDIPGIAEMKKIDAMGNVPDSALREALDLATEDIIKRLQRRIDALFSNNNLTAQPRKPAKRGAGKYRTNPARKRRVKA
jgi:predicted RNase H-like HicB family nuclease